VVPVLFVGIGAAETATAREAAMRTAENFILRCENCACDSEEGTRELEEDVEE
jgi:hypothetical protein